MNKFILLFILSSFVVVSNATTYYVTINSGNWANTSTWFAGHPAPVSPPNVSNVVTVNSGNEVELSGNLEFENNCELHVDGTLTIEGNLVAWNNLLIEVSGTGKLIILGNVESHNNQTITISGSVTVGGDVVANNNGNLNLDDGELLVGGDIICSQGDCSITGTGTIEIQGSNNYDADVPIGVTVNDHLPVQLLSFEAVCKNNAVDIEWSTASETNSSRFILEKSKDAFQYTVLVTLPATGNSNQRIDYSFSDEGAEDNTYYRLKQVDFNGKYEYYGPIAVSCSFSKRYHTYMNSETDDFVFLTSQSYSEISIHVYNLVGNLLYSKNANNEPKVSINLSHLSHGMYFVHVAFENQPGEVIKIVKD